MRVTGVGRLLTLSVLSLCLLWTTSNASSICFVEFNDMDAGKLYMIDPANPTPALLLDLSQDAFGDIRDPEFSPNGQWIAFSCEKDMMNTPWRSNLWIMDRNGQNLYSVTHLTPGSFPPGSPTGTVEGDVYEDGELKSGAWVYISSLYESVTADIYGHYRIENIPVGDQYVTAYDPNILYDDEDFGFMPVFVANGITMTADVTLSWDWDIQQGVKAPTWMPGGDQVVFIDNSGHSNRIGTDGIDLEEVVPLPEGVFEYNDVAVRPTTGEVAFITEVWYGDESLSGIWICDANGANMRQVVQDQSYGKGSLHWSPDGSLFGYSTQVVNQQQQYVNGIVFYDSQGQFQGGVAMDEGWFVEFGGWDPSQEYICITMWPSGDFDQTTLNTVRLSDFTTTQLYGPAKIWYPSWGPEASPAWEQPVVVSDELVLGPAFPNPSNGRVTVRLLGNELSVRPATIGVFDVAGRQVASLAEFESSVIWDGRDEQGRHVPAGTYLFKLMGATRAHAMTRVVIVR